MVVPFIVGASVDGGGEDSVGALVSVGLVAGAKVVGSCVAVLGVGVLVVGLVGVPVATGAAVVGLVGAVVLPITLVTCTSNKTTSKKVDSRDFIFFLNFKYNHNHTHTHTV